MGLVLEAVDVAGPWRWRWVLRDEETAEPLADHAVSLDPWSVEVTRFRDLFEYVESHAADPGRRTQDGARLVAQAGAWAGRELLGESVGAAILNEAPVTVRVRVPAALDHVLLWPLELAQADRASLAASGAVAFVYDVASGVPPQSKSEVGAKLRMLAVFSQPTDTSVLALRRERYALSRLIRRIAVREQALVELRVVQYGATRERLERIADSTDGWDVLHLSGHGTGAGFWLEHEDGSPDVVSADELVRLLRPARWRVKLAVVSACESAAGPAASALRLLGLAETDEAVPPGVGARGGGPGLARALAWELDCAVVAMRYPVLDEFAVAFADAFYENLYGEGWPVDEAAARARSTVAGQEASAARPAVSLATPGVFGAQAAGLRLLVPRGRPELNAAEQRVAYLPEEPARFLGRAEAMAQASAVLAPGSGKTAVLLHGMAGVGKTTGALELAYRHAENFTAIEFVSVPTRQEAEWASELADFAARLDIQLERYGVSLAGHVGTAAALETLLSQLRRVMTNSTLLLVLDNLEAALTPDGAWRDPRWGQLITALTAHDGKSRIILTSRIAPANLGTGVVTLPVHALGRDEAVALALELPNLRGLLHADPGPVPALDVAAADRLRLQRVLRIVQGHPKLMELADATAANRDKLDRQLAAAEAVSGGGGGEALEAFFRDGNTTLDSDYFLASLAGWTRTVMRELAPAAQVMASFVACLEDGDRRAVVIETNWPSMWQRLDLPGAAPGPGPLLAALAAAALAEAQGPASYRVHPGIAEAVTAAAGTGFRGVVDAELGAFWTSIARQAAAREGGEDGALVVRAGLAAAPYLLRRGEWKIAGILLEEVTRRDRSPHTAQVVLPGLRRVATATGAPADVGVLAAVLSGTDPDEAERLLRRAMLAADAAGDHRVAASVAGYLINLLQKAGRLAEALETADAAAAYTRLAGLGPWTQLGEQARRLQLLAQLGEHELVLAEATRLRAAMGGLPDRAAADETVNPWNIRELILYVARTSAQATGDWPRCLELNAQITASLLARNAGQYELTRSLFNDAGPLIRLGRLAEAGRLLAECQRLFEAHDDSATLAAVLSTRAELEVGLGHGQAAADLERAAIRLQYTSPEPRNIAIDHHNLANYLGGPGGDRAEQRAHRLAAALIRRLAGLAHDLDRTIRALAAELGADDGGQVLPSTVARVAEAAGRTEGVRLAELLAALQPDPQAVEAALAEILTAASTLLPDARAGQ